VEALHCGLAIEAMMKRCRDIIELLLRFDIPLIRPFLIRCSERVSGTKTERSSETKIQVEEGHWRGSTT
jgi:hypothetical protein